MLIMIIITTGHPQERHCLSCLMPLPRARHMLWLDDVDDNDDDDDVTMMDDVVGDDDDDVVGGGDDVDDDDDDTL
jgi:hypothetical protein